MMIKESLRDAAYAAAPRYVIAEYLRHRMMRQARRLSKLRDSGCDSSVLLEVLGSSHFFRPLQKKTEILGLLQVVKGLRPSAICEIGAAGCGTTFLLTQAAERDATIIALDLAFTDSRQAAIESFALPTQSLFCFREDSHRVATERLVRDRLAGKSLDVLFLDGDHRYEGIKADFELYSPLVRSGGLIVFHDIVLDYKSRYGTETSSDAGGVPQFWQEIKYSYQDVQEIVEDYEQDGFGIGVLRWNGLGLTCRDNTLEGTSDLAT